MRPTSPLRILVLFLGVLAVACNDSSSALGPSDSRESRKDSLAADSAGMAAGGAGLDRGIVAWKASFPSNSLTPAAVGACPESAMPRVFPVDTADLRPTASPVVALVLGPRPRLKLPGLLSDRCTVDLGMLAHP